MSADVDQQVGRPCQMQQFVPRQPDAALFAFHHEGRRRPEAELLRHLSEVGKIDGPLELAARSGRVDARGRGDLLEEEHVAIEPLQAERPAETRPGAAAVARPIGQGAANNNGRNGNRASVEVELARERAQHV